MIEAKFNGNEHKLEITGHAMYGEEGKDIVCAAVSILFYTLSYNLDELKHVLKGPAKKAIGEDASSIQCVPKDEYKQTVELIFWTFLNGIQLLADDYPDNVKLTFE